MLADSGYAHRTADGWAVPLRAAGASLIQDLHPDDRGPQGTHHGAIISNGNLYCPDAPRPLLELGPLARNATREQTTAHDQQTAERPGTSSGKSPLRTLTATTASCAPPSWARSAARYAPQSMALDRQRPEILTPPARPARPAAPSRPSPSRPRSAAKTTQKHDYPSNAHRQSYARRTGAERAFSTVKDPASTTSPAAGAASWA